MVNERHGTETVRELRLEGAGILVLGALLVAGLVGAFFLGRWYEQRNQPSLEAAGGGSDPLAHVFEAQPTADVERTANYFDTLEGAEKELEPRREIAAPEKAPEKPRAATTAESSPKSGGTEARRPPVSEKPAPASPAPGPGSFYVQVFAGRDRGSAEGVVDRLKVDGLAVRMFSETTGGDDLFKVRVGGYATRDEAVLVARELQKKGYSGAWVAVVN